jgi:hypothetical protein
LKIHPVHARGVANHVSGQRPSQEGLARPFGATNSPIRSISRSGTVPSDRKSSAVF